MDHERFPATLIYVSLFAVRCGSAVLNIVHDCDEVYNYWEPLHMLLYGFGKQPWEYSPQFALRSYLYLLIHYAVASPLTWIFGAAENKVLVFYGMRITFAVFSAVLECRLHRSVCRLYPDVSLVFFVVLLCNSGLAMGSTTFLPSSFTMHCMTAATEAYLNRNTTGLIVWSVVGVVVGWPVGGIAFLPYAIHVLMQPEIGRSFLKLFVSVTAIAALSAISDMYFYGKYTVSLMNFVKYNVIGGGQSALYGIESSTFYMRNGLLNFNLMLVSFCALPLVAGAVLFTGSSSEKTKKDDKRTAVADSRTAVTPWNLRRLLISCAPAYIWVLALSLLPHKEERFMYVVYPQICLSGALCVVLATGRPVMNSCPKAVWRGLAKALESVSLLVYVSLSLMRIAAIWMNLRAPMEVYRHLPVLQSVGKAYVCTGDEWHRFPSSFFLPDPAYRLGFLRQKFSGLLPGDFSEESMGTRTVQSHFNDENKPDPSSFVDITSCLFVVDFERIDGESLRKRHDPNGDWTAIANLTILDRQYSPLPFRMFYIPFFNIRHNRFGSYVLYGTRGNV